MEKDINVEDLAKDYTELKAAKAELEKANAELAAVNKEIERKKESLATLKEKKERAVSSVRQDESRAVLVRQECVAEMKLYKDKLAMEKKEADKAIGTSIIQLKELEAALIKSCEEKESRLASVEKSIARLKSKLE
jgi:peptidoglycan hydrolase CwlO-like protein